MSFKDCIESAVETGRISAKRGAEGKAAFDKHFADAKAGGMDDVAAIHAAQNSAVEAVSSAKGEKAWERLNDMKKAHKHYLRFKDAADPGAELDGLLANIQTSYDRISGQAQAYLSQMLLKYKPTYGGLVQTLDNMDGVIEAAYKTGGNAEAKQMAEALGETYEFLRTRANAEGVSIPKNDKFILPQTQDRIKVNAVLEPDFVNDMQEHLDWNVMEFYGEKVLPSARPDVLVGRYKNIITNGNISINPAQANVEHLAGRMSRDRFFYYKSADSWKKMQEKYGSGNVFQQTIGMIDKMSRDIATIEHLGANPNVMKAFVEKLADKRAAELQVAKKPKGKSWQVRTNDAKSRFDRGYKIFSHHVLNGEESVSVQTLSTIRTSLVTAKLGGAFLSNLNDIMTAKWAAHLNGLPEVGLIRQYISNFINGKISAEQAIQDGVIYQSGTSLAHGYQRYFGPLDGPIWAQRFSDIVYRSQGATLHNSTIRHVTAQRLQGYWGLNAGKTFDKLGARHVAALEAFGITEKDWDEFRKTPLSDKNFLRPIAMRQAGGNGRIADKFADFMMAHIRLSAPERSLRTRTFLAEDIPVNSFAGQRNRALSVLTGFPAEIMFNHWKRIMEAPTPKDKGALAARFFIYMTLGGAFITQVKALAAGDNPYDMTTGSFWLRAALNGGSLGFLGDFIFNNINIANSQYFSGGTPVGEYGKKLMKFGGRGIGEAGELLGLTEEDDRHFGKAALDLANASIPKLWYFKLLFERYVQDDLEQRADPEAWRRKQKFQAENKPQGKWWAPGEDPELPNLMTAFGGS